jgi:hypothetical protein
MQKARDFSAHPKSAKDYAMITLARFTIDIHRQGNHLLAGQHIVDTEHRPIRIEAVETPGIDNMSVS